MIFKIFVYSRYEKKYNLPKDFRFNGMFIRFYGDGKIKFGENCYISYFSYLNVMKDSRLIVGNNVSIAHNVKIYTSSFDSEALVRTGKKNNKCADVIVGDNVLLGSNVFVCPGVVIGNNVIIGANSVVSRSVPDNCIAAGSPAKVIKTFNDII